MINSLLYSGQQWISHWLQQPRFLLVLRLTVIIILLHSPDQWGLVWLPEKLLCIAMLLRSQWMIQPKLWLALSIVMILKTLWLWFLLMNHEYLLTYWCLVCTLAVQSRSSDLVLSWNAKFLIGLCFLFSTVWKFLGGEYLDGSFLHLTFLVDSRLSMGAVLLGRLSPELLEGNQELFFSLQTPDPTGTTMLATSPVMSVLSVILSYWTILIEGAIAIAFLVPQSRWLRQHRDALLIVFILTTYAFVPVVSFAVLLILLGLAQCNPDHSRLVTTYFVLLLLTPIWVLLPQAIFHFMLQLG